MFVLWADSIFYDFADPNYPALRMTCKLGKGKGPAKSSARKRSKGDIAALQERFAAKIASSANRRPSMKKTKKKKARVVEAGQEKELRAAGTSVN